jgi:hypothetical protein
MKQSIAFLKAFVVTLCIFSSTTILAQNYPEGMVSYWKGDGNADDAYNDNDGSLMNGATATATGQVGQAFSFDGINDYVKISNAPSLNITEAITVVAWVKPNGWTGDYEYLLEKGTWAGNGAWFFFLYRNSGVANFCIGIPGGIFFKYCEMIGELADGEWSQIVGTYDRQNIKFYVNGVLNNQVEWTEPIRLNSHHVYIGSEGTARHFKGKIDEVAIYNRALTADEITQHYRNGLNGLGYDSYVPIDIKPGSYPNSINLDSEGVIPVAILGNSTFDVETINQTTLEFEGNGAREKGKSGKIGAFEDVNDDGFLDLVVHFPVEELDLTDQDTEGTLTGSLFDGTPIEGTDDICIVPSATAKKDLISGHIVLATNYALAQNHPNPFNPLTSIQFSIPEENEVLLEIYNSRGQKVETLVNKKMGIGYHVVRWDATNMPSGIYFYKIKAGSFHDLKKMILMR